MKPRPVTGIDSHAHVMNMSATLVSERHSAPRRDVTAREYVGLLGAHGLSHGVLTAPSFLGADNSLLLQALDAFPDRLAGSVIVDPGVDEAVLHDMRRRGAARAAELDPPRQSAGRRAPSTPLVQEAGRGGHARGAVRGGRARRSHRSAPAGRRHPRGDRPFRRARSGAGRQRPRLRADSARRRHGPGLGQALRAVPPGRRDPRRYVDALLQAGGPGQLMWGSDFPWVSHEDYLGGPTFGGCLQWLSDWVPDESVRRTILCDTPAQLYGFAAPRPA
nr:amidohydrolase family protein [Achromobacter sp. DMS1]